MGVDRGETQRPNRRGVPTARGGRWEARTVANVLRRGVAEFLRRQGGGDRTSLRFFIFGKFTKELGVFSVEFFWHFAQFIETYVSTEGQPVVLAPRPWPNLRTLAASGAMPTRSAGLGLARLRMRRQ